MLMYNPGLYKSKTLLGHNLGILNSEEKRY